MKFERKAEHDIVFGEHQANDILAVDWGQLKKEKRLREWAVCSDCSGSGEGHFDWSICSTCGGVGEICPD